MSVLLLDEIGEFSVFECRPAQKRREKVHKRQKLERTGQAGDMELQGSRDQTAGNATAVRATCARSSFFLTEESSFLAKKPS